MTVRRITDKDTGETFDIEVPDEPDQPGPGDHDRTPDEWAKLRQERKRVRELEEAKTLADRKLAFYEAGLDPTDPRGELLFKGYDGPLDPDKIYETAVKAGIATPKDNPEVTGAPVDPLAVPNATVMPEQSVADLAAAQRIAAMAVGTSPEQRNPLAALDEAYARGGNAAMEQLLRQSGIPVIVDGQG